MSNALAIAGVTHVMKDLIHNGLVEHDIATVTGGTINVSTLAPDRIQTDKDEPTQLNLFLYQATANQGWRNMELPARDNRGERTSNPPLALDLHYLLTAYGAGDLCTEILLGSAMQILHETPVLTRDFIRGHLQNVSSSMKPVGESGLADQIEQIKITLQPFGIEELSKLWTAFQTHYRPTVGYLVTVILIESELPLKSPLPVRERNLRVQQFRRPAIDAVLPQVVEAGGSIIIHGTGLTADVVNVSFGAITAQPESVSEDEIHVRLPKQLRAGVQTVRVFHLVDFGTTVEPHRGIESNIVPFVLAAKITTPEPITVQRGHTLSLAIVPPVGVTQKAMLIIGERTITIPPRGTEEDETTSTLEFPIPLDCPVGTFLMRIQIDGAQSLLEIDEDANSPTFGQYIGPEVKVIE